MTVKQVCATSKSAICLGQQGENAVVEVIFQQPSELMAEEWQLNHQRAADRAAYPCPLEKRENSLVWRVTSGDTANHGTGVAQLICYGKSGEVLKSRIYSTVVLKSVTAGGEAPDPVKPWYEDIMMRLNQGGVSSVADVPPDSNGNVPLTAKNVGALPSTGGNVIGEIRMNGQPISGLNQPTEDTQAANKGYVDGKHIYATANLIASGWTSTAPYTQTVTVAGVLGADSPHVAPLYDATLDTAQAQQEAWTMVSKAVAGSGSITFTCFEDKPGVDIPIQVEVNR